MKNKKKNWAKYMNKNLRKDAGKKYIKYMNLSIYIHIYLFLWFWVWGLTL